MAAYSQVSENKRGRDEYWSAGLALPGAKRTISRTLAYDSDLMSLLDKIDNLDYDSNPERTDAVNEVEGGMRLNMIIKSMEEEVGLKAQPYNNFDEKGSNDQMGSIKQRELIEWNSEANNSVCEIGDFKNYEHVGAELGFMADHISPHEFGIVINYIDGDLMANTMYYSDVVYGSADTAEDFYGFLWEDDIWQLNEHPVIRKDFASPQQEEIGISGAEFHGVWNDARPILNVNENKERL